MKKVIGLFAALLLALLLGLYQGAYACVGHWLYETVTDLEATLYGFEEHRVDIGEMEWVLYRNDNAGKPAIVMVHGFSADKDVWPRFAKHFVADFDVIIPDLAGHGDTGFDATWDYSIAAQTARVAALLAALNIEQAHIIGNSMGGYLAAQFAISYPQQTLSATMVDPAGVSFPQPSEMYQLIAQGDNPFFIENRRDFDRFYPMTMAQPPYLPKVVLAAVAQKYIERREQLEKIFNDFHGSELLDDQLSQLTAPAMLWWGDQDRLLHVSAVPVWQAGVPQLATHVFEGIGHMPMVEIPQQTATLYRAFLDGL
ncbi:MAG: alpha/beta hydrolase [Bacterioplanes sp.]|nr:alpha/beta hydrolase [Bacterioplanes sp.]